MAKKTQKAQLEEVVLTEEDLKANPELVEAGVKEGDVIELPIQEAVEAKEVTVKYRDHKGEVAERTFSKEVHGDNFNELAEEFKATNAARIVA
jgi:hypothetical protein